MSVLIKGMEMPKNCAWCRFLQSTDPIPKRELFCGIDTTNNIHDYRPDKGCPLVPVPPHGDLIDRGYAIATACSGRIRTLPTTEDGENWIRVKEVRESIKNAPTIIPAEEGE